MNMKDLYRSMLRIRRVEEKIAEEYALQQMRCPVHLSIGQEAIAVGVCATLRQSDIVFSNHRAHAHYLAKGGDLCAMIAELYGLENGYARGVGGSMHMIDLNAGFLGAVPVVGATIPVAVGAAWAAKLQHKDTVVAVFFGDGAFEEGVVHESLNFAVLHSLPVLFVCENNLYACYSRLNERQPQRPIHKVAKAHGCLTAALDGNDVICIYKKLQDLIGTLRTGGKPVFLECATYRRLEHCGPSADDYLGYRPQAEREYWEENCPISRIEQLMQSMPEAATFIRETNAEISTEIELSFKKAKSGRVPDFDDLKGYLYA